MKNVFHPSQLEFELHQPNICHRILYKDVVAITNQSLYKIFEAMADPITSDFGLQNTQSVQ